MNFTFGAIEIWGHRAHLETKGDLFQYFFSFEGLVDIALPPHMLTWHNKRTCLDTVAKILEGFLISGALIEDMGSYRTWVDKIPLSDHFPILLQLDPSR